MDYRPLKDEYLAVAKLLQGDLYLRLDEQSFVEQMTRFTHGQTSPKRAKQIYYDLLREARK